jgi:zinc D-Ala-D-Ala dipeptidase
MQRLGLQKSIFTSILGKVRWECGHKNPPVELLRRRFGALVAPSPKTGTHMSVSAVDISVVGRAAGEDADRGAPYLEMSELTPMDSPFISEKAAENRGKITAILKKHGFAAYPFEFWHYSGGDAFFEYIGGSGKPARYGPVDIGPGGSVSPVDNPLEPLVSDDEFERLIREASAEKT